MNDRNADDARSLRLDEPPLPAAPACLFLDVDGTLVDFALRPDGIAVDQALISLLHEALRVTRGAVALVSGRPVQQLDRLFAPLRMPTAGVHGCERRDATGRWHRPAEPDGRLAEARSALESLAPSMQGLIVEDKVSAVALHYRSAPQWKSQVRAAMSRLAESMLPGYELLDGNDVFELKPRSCSKAAAIEAFLAEAPFAGLMPVFLGDDATDRDGFDAVRRHQGIAIAVGDRVSADWRLADPNAVRSWLRRFVERPGAAS